MSTNDPQFALLRIQEPKGEQYTELRTDWQRLRRACDAHAEKKPEIETLGSCALLLPVPSTFPILCELVADAQRSGHKYSVRLFGQPVLTYCESK